jgi:MFS family permease
MEAVFERTWTWPDRVQARPRAARRAVAALFFLNGALFATWVSRIPAVQSERGLSHGALGLALLAVALGAVIAMPLAGWFTARFGSDKVSKISALVYCAALPLPILAPNMALFGVSLFLFGAFHGGLDVAMNAQAVAVEKLYPEPIMSSFHALFSTGGLVGAVAGGLLAALGLDPRTHLSLVALMLGAVTLRVSPYLLDVGEREAATSPKTQRKTPGSLLPARGLMALGALALCVMMGEGAMADWSAVYLRNNLLTTESIAAAGYAAFSIAMAGGRFFGDRLTTRFGPVLLVRVSGGVAAAGLTVALFFEQTAITLVGFACVGAGFSTIVPMVFSAAGRTDGVAPGVALAAVSTMGYFGFLAGPPFIGFMAELFGLRGAFGIIIATSLLAAVLAPAVGRRPRPATLPFTAPQAG